MDAELDGDNILDSERRERAKSEERMVVSRFATAGKGEQYEEKKEANQSKTTSSQSSLGLFCVSRECSAVHCFDLPASHQPVSQASLQLEKGLDSFNDIPLVFGPVMLMFGGAKECAKQRGRCMHESWSRRSSCHDTARLVAGAELALLMLLYEKRGSKASCEMLVAVYRVSSILLEIYVLAPVYVFKFGSNSQKKC